MPRHDEKPRLSLRISGTALSIRYSANLIFAAPEGVEAMSVQDSALLNSPVRTLSYLSGCSDYTTTGSTSASHRRPRSEARTGDRSPGTGTPRRSFVGGGVEVTAIVQLRGCEVSRRVNQAG